MSLPHTWTAPLRFFDFPAEIRFRIYAFIMHFGEVITLRLKVPTYWCHSDDLMNGRPLHPTILRSVRLSSNFFWLRHHRPNSLLYPVDFSLLRTCRAVYHEAARILHGKNIFSFGTDNGWLAFLIFVRRLTNPRSLRKLQFCPTTLFDSSAGDRHEQLSYARCAALTAIKELPVINSLKFVICTDITEASVGRVSELSRALAGNPCELVLKERGWKQCLDDTTWLQLPQIHRGPLVVFREYGWKLPTAVEDVNTVGSCVHGL